MFGDVVERRERPIGYWLKHVDTLLESTFRRTLDDHGLDRRTWQVLNVLSREASTPAGLEAALAPFLVEDPGAVDTAVADLLRRGWAERDGELVVLTPAGRAAHADVAAQVHRIRQRAVQGIGADEYRTVITTLQRMAANLEPTPAG